MIDFKKYMDSHKTKLLLIFFIISISFGCTFFYKLGKINRGPIIATAYDRKLSVFSSIPRTENDIIFIGHSLVNEYLLSDFLPEYKMINMGIGGDNISGVTNRLDVALQYNVKSILVQIGINDIYNKIPIDTICNRYETLIKAIKQKTNSPLIVFNIFPTGKKLANEKVEIVNAFLDTISQKYEFILVDVYSIFSKDGILNSDFGCGDATHFSGRGYLEWSKIIREVFREQNIH